MGAGFHSCPNISDLSFQPYATLSAVYRGFKFVCRVQPCPLRAIVSTAGNLINRVQPYQPQVQLSMPCATVSAICNHINHRCNLVYHVQPHQSCAAVSTRLVNCHVCSIAAELLAWAQYLQCFMSAHQRSPEVFKQRFWSRLCSLLEAPHATSMLSSS